MLKVGLPITFAVLSDPFWVEDFYKNSFFIAFVNTKELIEKIGNSKIQVIDFQLLVLFYL